MKCIRIILILTSFPILSYGQQDAQFSQFMFNPLYYNPAAAGIKHYAEFNILARSQWAGLSSPLDGKRVNPNSQVISASIPFFTLKGGFGFHLINDNLGAQNNLEAQLSYSYHHQIPDGKLSFGLRAGIFTQTLDFDKYRPTHPSDPVLASRSGIESQVRPDMAAGAMAETDKFTIGVSLNHLIKTEFDFGVSSLRKALDSNLTIFGTYHHEFSYNLTVSPSILVKSDLNVYSFDIGAIATVNNNMWGGLTFRKSEAIVLILGYGVMQDGSLRFGYSFDYTIKAREVKATASHELMVVYRLPLSKEGPKVIKTPRFIL